MAFSQDEKIFASGGCQNRDENLVCRSGIIYLWDVDSGEMIGDPIISHTSWVTGLAFSPNGKTLASGSTDDSILLLDLVTKEIIGIPFLGHNQKVTSIAFSPDGKMLASGGQDLRIILWDVPTHQPITKFNPYGYNVVTTLAFSSNGDYLVSGDIDGNIMLWEVSPNRWKLATCQRIGRNFTQEEWAFYFPGETYRITCPQWPAGE